MARQFGLCAPLEQAEAAKAAGFDYLEGPLVSLLGDEDDEAFAPVLEAYRASPLPVRAFNFFLPGDLKVVGPEADEVRLTRYTERALKRAAAVGAERVVFGSGRSRSIPEGFDADEAKAQVVRFLRQAGEVAQAHSLVIAIEPLRKGESNLINTVADGAALAQEVNHPAVKVLADFYHMDEEDEPLENLVTYGDWLEHVHVADTGRYAPGTGDYPYARFAENLRQAGYEGLISVEGNWRDFATEAPAAVAFLRCAFERG